MIIWLVTQMSERDRVQYLEGGTEPDTELEQQEGDDRPHEDGLRAARLCRSL